MSAAHWNEGLVKTFFVCEFSPGLYVVQVTKK